MFMYNVGISHVYVSMSPVYVGMPHVHVGISHVYVSMPPVYVGTFVYHMFM